MPSASDRSSFATEAVPAIDVWGWTKEAKPALDDVLTVKEGVLLHPSLRAELQTRLSQVDEQAEPRLAGLCWWMLGQYSRAWPHLVQVRGAGPEVTFAKAECALRGRVSDEEGRRPTRRPDLALKLLGKSAELAGDLRAYGLRLQALIFEHDYDGLGKALGEAPAGFAGSADAACYAGILAEEDGHEQQALASYAEALEREPEHRQTLFRMAVRAQAGDDDDAALQLYRRLASMKPADIHSLINLGVVLEDMNRFHEAAAVYRRVVHQFPTHTRAVGYLRDALGSRDMVFDEDSERTTDKRNRLLRIPINDFELSVRARNCLSKMKIETLADLVQRTEAELLTYKNFGETSLAEIKILLDSKSLRLGMNLDEDPIPLHPPGAEPVPPERAEIKLPPGVDPSIIVNLVADMDFSVRVRKALSQMDIVTLGDLLKRTEADFLTLKNFGQTSLNELRSRLAEHGLTLRPA